MLLPFCLALIGLVFSSRLFPSFPFFTFAPLLAIALIRKPLLPLLRTAALSGLVYDLLSSNLHFGLYSLAFALTVLPVFRLKKFFFETNAFSLAFLSILVSIIFHLISVILFSSFGSPPPFNGKSLACIIFLSPLCDGLLSILLFSCPLSLYGYVKKRGLLRMYKRRRA